MSAQTTKIEKPRVAVMILADRGTLAEWEEARAFDPEAMAFAEFISAWSLDEDEIVITMAVEVTSFASLVAEMRNTAWAVAALREELTLEAREIIDQHACTFLEEDETYKVDAEAAKEPWPVYVSSIEEEDIPY